MLLLLWSSHMLILTMRENNIRYVYWLLSSCICQSSCKQSEHRPTCSIHGATAAETTSKQDSVVQLAYFGTCTQLSSGFIYSLDHNLRATITSNAALSHLFAQPLLLSFTHSGLVIIIIILIGSCRSSRTSQRSCRPQGSRRHPSLRGHALG